MSTTMFRLIALTVAFCIAVTTGLVLDIDLGKVFGLAGFVMGFDAWVNYMLTRVVINGILMRQTVLEADNVRQIK